MTKLQRLHTECGQSPWLDNITRHLRDGTSPAWSPWASAGSRPTPTIFARAIAGSTDYDDQFSSLVAAGCSGEAAY
jgi:transaldolase